jgi:hypothetical protein
MQVDVLEERKKEKFFNQEKVLKNRCFLLPRGLDRSNQTC